MGGPGSGSFPDDGSSHRGGRKKRAAVAVVGTGNPEKPDGLPDGVGDCWDRIAETVQGVAFSQDSEAITEAAWLLWRQEQFREKLHEDPTSDELNRVSLAIGRALATMLTQFGMTPRSRQILLVPKEPEEKDEFEKMMEEAGG
jgi:phage terminase small subunit